MIGQGQVRSGVYRRVTVNAETVEVCNLTVCSLGLLVSMMTIINNHHFYSASALLAMQSAVLARWIPSVCPSVCVSVCLSVTFRYCVQKNEDTIVRFSASGRTIPLVSGEVKFIRIAQTITLKAGH